MISYNVRAYSFSNLCPRLVIVFSLIKSSELKGNGKQLWDRQNVFDTSLLIMMDHNVISQLGLSDPGECISEFKFIKITRPSLWSLHTPIIAYFSHCHCPWYSFQPHLYKRVQRETLFSSSSTSSPVVSLNVPCWHIPACKVQKHPVQQNCLK